MLPRLPDLPRKLLFKKDGMFVGVKQDGLSKSIDWKKQ